MRKPQNIALDWALTMDKGVAGRFIGGAFADLVVESILHPGGTQAQQVAQLNADVQTYYEDNESTDRIHEMKNMCLPTSVMRDVPTFSPGTMSKVRALVGFAKEYAGNIVITRLCETFTGRRPHRFSFICTKL